MLEFYEPLEPARGVHSPPAFGSIVGASDRHHIFQPSLTRANCRVNIQRQFTDQRRTGERLLRALVTTLHSAPARAQVKIRNKHVPALATLYPTPDPARIEAHFDEPQRAVTPGQGAVFYDDSLVLGGGWIE